MKETPLTQFETVIYEKSDGIAYITLNRPALLNAFNIQMRDDLFQILAAIRDDSDVRVVIVKGAGERAFCVGADLIEFGTAPSRVIARQVRFERDLWGLFLSLSQPLIAALHGYVLGSGVEIALCCDIRVAAEDARFGLPEVTLGLIPAAGGTQTLPRMVGRGKALELLLANKWLDAREAHAIGLVNKVVAHPDLLPTAQELANKIMSRGPWAVKYVKEAINRGLDMTLKEGLELERRLASFVLASEGAREGDAL